MGEKSAANLVAALERARKTTLPRLLVALGIPDVGASVAELLAAHFGDLEPLLAARVETLEEIDGVGPVIAQRVADVLRRRAPPQRDRAAARARRALREDASRAPRRRARGPLAGKTFVLTGTLPALVANGGGRRASKPPAAR